MVDKNFKIVDSFLFSEVYEKELLLLKLILEDKGVDEWVLLENAYSFQGDYTGLHAKNMVENDTRFAPYLHKLTIISKEEKTKILPRHQLLDEFSFKVEFWQRDLAYDYFINNYDDNDWIIISDVDEMLDFSDDERRAELVKKMNESLNGVLDLPTKRFWYDFDNEYRALLWRPMCSKKYLKNTNKLLHQVRLQSFQKKKHPNWKNIIGFEYSSCYEPGYMLRKLYTSTHTGFTPNDLRQSLRCNHRPAHEVAKRKVKNNKSDFLKVVSLNEKNSPKYVRENLSFYKTNAIDKNYKRNRREDYPELFTLKYFMNEFVGEKNKWLKKKFRFLLQRLRLYKLIYG